MSACFDILRKSLTIFTRVVTFVYAILAIFAFLECRNLLRGSRKFVRDGTFHTDGDGTLYVPLAACFPTDVDIISENSITVTGSTDSKCDAMDFVINACAAGLFLSAFASIFFVSADFLVRHGHSPFNTSSVVGMGVFLTIILIQTGISTGALVEQIRYWVEYLELVVEQTNASLKVESYANPWILVTSAIGAFGTAGLIFFDVLIYHCWEKDDRSNKHSVDQKVIDEFVQTSNANMELVANTSESRYDSDGKLSGSIRSPSSSHDEATTTMTTNVTTPTNDSSIALPSWAAPV